MTDYVYCSNREWSLQAFLGARTSLPGTWSLCLGSEDLQPMLTRVQPRYVFFPHWSYIVPDNILVSHECVCFHMSDVPFGRGGSPLQNLIARGHNETMLTALRMSTEIDAGPVYFKRPLSLEGSAESIFRRAAHLCVEMMAEIVATEPPALPQQGDPTVFKRRTPKMSVLPETGGVDDLYDHIRMLDAPGYPHAFLHHGDFVAVLTDAHLTDDAVEARVRFERRKGIIR